VDGIDPDARLIGLGMDFGFTNDPTSLVEVYSSDGELWVNELIYETRLTTSDIVGRMRELSVSTAADIIADSADPRSIQEIANGGYNIYPVVKSPDSIRAGINLLKRYKLNITRSSEGLRKELLRYKWQEDKDGKPLNKPIDIFNHSLDALRYLALARLGSEMSTG
jgi:phage terminase large subunit